MLNGVPLILAVFIDILQSSKKTRRPLYLSPIFRTKRMPPEAELSYNRRLSHVIPNFYNFEITSGALN